MYRRRHGGHGGHRRRRGGRIERFQVAAILLLLSERPGHGYDLLERLPAVIEEERVDVGNLYRVLRSLEEQGLVASEWDETLPGPAKRTYELTDAGRRLLDRWAEALRQAQDVIGGFIRRYEEGR
jgi:PadR family transcriptional regulator, regulatory protein PadR